VNIHQFPKEIGEWSSLELPITEEEYAILETRNAFARKYYTDDGKEVFLLIVYSQNNRKVSHPPEICYTGSGVTILSNTRDSFAAQSPKVRGSAVFVNKLQLELKSTQQISFYWFKVGDTFTTNYWKQQALIALKTLSGRPASSALIRVSSTIEKEHDRAISSLKEFCSTITPQLFEYLP